MRTNNTTKKHRSHIGLVILLLLVVAVFCGGILYVQNLTDPVDRSSKKDVIVQIPSGSTTDSIGAVLAKKGLIRSSSSFRVYSRLTRRGGQYQAGTYSLSPSMGMDEISKIIASGKVTTSSFTIPEGYMEYEVAKKLSKEGLVDEDDFINVIENHDFTKEFPFLKEAPKGKHRLEGYLFPSTYSVPVGADSEYIVRTMLKGYQDTFTDAYRIRAKELGYTERQVLTVASIVEEESGNEADKPKVASVIYNRLKANMPLQMDSTVQYVLKLQGKDPDRILYKDLKVKSKYNTYQNPGLPPSPICSPGAKSIRAALYPAKTDDLYFVLSDKLDGTSKFSKSYSQFLKDQDAYHKALEKQDARNEKK